MTHTPDPRKGMIVSVFTSEHSNDSGFRSLTLVGEGVPEIHSVTLSRPAVEVVPGNLPGTVKAVLAEGVDSPAAFIAPASPGRGSHTWSMASGCFIDSSDSRFRDISHHPVPLHNRYELEAVR